MTDRSDDDRTGNAAYEAMDHDAEPRSVPSDVDIDQDWYRTMTKGLSVAEIRRIADLTARRASRDGSAVTNADIEDALRRHLMIAVG